MSCRQRRKQQYFPLERRPRMLRDFLLDDSNSCSSNGFKSFPRKPASCHIDYDSSSSSTSTIRNLIHFDLINTSSTHANAHAHDDQSRLQRSRSKAATTISAVHSIINAVKNNIHLLTSVKSPSLLLPRSLSRKLSRKSRINSQTQTQAKITVRVKDIIRWKSFRDLVEERSPPLDSTTTGSTCTPCSTSTSNGSSWCDSDFTSEYGEQHEADDVVSVGKKFLPCVGKDDPVETAPQEAANTPVGPEERKYYESEEGKEQHSPLSVLEYNLEYEEEDDDEECLLSSSSFNQSLATMQRTKQKLMRKIQRLEALAKLEPANLEQWMLSAEEGIDDYDDDDVEEEEEEETDIDEAERKAWQLLNHVRETTSLKSYTNIESVDKLLLDLFKEEVATTSRGEEVEQNMVRQARAWINGEEGEIANWEERGMEREGKWIKLEEEQQELGREVESGVMDILVDELLLDLLNVPSIPMVN